MTTPDDRPDAAPSGPTNPTPRQTTPPSPQQPVAPGPLMGAYPSVIVYLVGYFAIALILSFVFAIFLAILMAAGAVPPMSGDLGAVGMDVEAILEIMSPYLLPIAIFLGLYSIIYTWAFMRLIDRRPLRSLGLALRPGWLADFGRGVLAAAILLGIVFAISLLTGGIRVEGFARPAPEGTSIIAYLIGAIVAFVFIGAYEEIMFRGYVLQRLEERSGKFVAVAVSSIVFALLHGANPGASWFGIFNTIVIGVLLAALYYRSRSLWMPIGFHFGWNFLLGYAYTLPVSGIPIYGILNVVEVEPGDTPGAGYGPEADIAATIAVAAWGAWMLWRHTRKRRRQQATPPENPV